MSFSYASENGFFSKWEKFRKSFFFLSTSYKVEIGKIFLLSIDIIITKNSYSNKVLLNNRKKESLNPIEREIKTEQCVFPFVCSHTQSHTATAITIRKKNRNSNLVSLGAGKKLLRFIFYSFNCTNLIQQNHSVYVLCEQKEFSSLCRKVTSRKNTKKQQQQQTEAKMLSMRERRRTDNERLWIYQKFFSDLSFTRIWHKIRYQDAQVELILTKTASL